MLVKCISGCMQGCSVGFAFSCSATSTFYAEIITGCDCGLQLSKFFYWNWSGCMLFVSTSSFCSILKCFVFVVLGCYISLSSLNHSTHILLYTNVWRYPQQTFTSVASSKNECWAIKVSLSWRHGLPLDFFRAYIYSIISHCSFSLMALIMIKMIWRFALHILVSGFRKTRSSWKLVVLGIWHGR